MSMKKFSDRVFLDVPKGATKSVVHWLDACEALAKFLENHRTGIDVTVTARESRHLGGLRIEVVEVHESSVYGSSYHARDCPQDFGFVLACEEYCEEHCSPYRDTERRTAVESQLLRIIDNDPHFRDLAKRPQ